MIYTTSAIESLNSVIRKAIKKRKLFPTDDSAKKAIQAASKKMRQIHSDKLDNNPSAYKGAIVLVLELLHRMPQFYRVVYRM